MTDPTDRDAVTATVQAADVKESDARAGTIGRYRLEQVLGAGGMGIVHAAFDPDLERRVAIKVLHRTDDPDAHARLLREARAMARLKHANVVTVYEVGTDADDFVVMELFDGGSLASWLREQPRSPREIVSAFVAAGRGLAAAHAADLVHRDFKPHNVLRSGDGRIAVTDFGLARGVGLAASGRRPDPDLADAGSRTSDALTKTGSIVGTPAYMAPEQWEPGGISPASDQFAFCVALWEALAGARPFTGTTSEELRAQVAQGPSAADAKRIPRRLRSILRRGLDPDPARRWPSMDALLAAIARRAVLVPVALGMAVAIAAVVAVLALRPGHAAREAVTLARADFDELVYRLDTRSGGGYFYGHGPGARLDQISDALLMKAGLRDKDRLLRVAGRPFARDSFADLAFIDHFDIELERAGEPLTLAVSGGPPDVTDPALDSIVKRDATHTVIPRALVSALQAHPSWLDAGVHANRLFVGGEDRGLWLDVRPYSIYWHVGLADHDRVIAIDGAPPTEPAQLVNAFRRLGPGSRLVLEIDRPLLQDIMHVTLELEVAQ